MDTTHFWLLFGSVFALWLLFVGWTSVKFGSDDGVDRRSLKDKQLNEKDVRKLKALGLSDEELQDVKNRNFDRDD